MSTVAFVPILFAAIASVLIGWVWYSPRVFGGMWLRLTNLSPEQTERGKKRMWIMALLGLLASMVVAGVMEYFGIAWQVYDWAGALELGFLCWIGFCAPTLLGQVLWDQKPVRLYLINALYWLLSFLAMALILLSTSSFFVQNPHDTGNTDSYVGSE